MKTLTIILLSFALLLTSQCGKSKNNPTSPSTQPNTNTPTAIDTLPDTLSMLGLSDPFIFPYLDAGTFQMGSSRDSSERPVHTVTLSAFKISAYPVTQKLYDTIMHVLPSTLYDFGPSKPVYNVTWFDAVLFCNALSKRMNKDTLYHYTAMTGTAGNGCTNLLQLSCDTTRKGFRLPTEAEWEYACRAGTTTDYFWGRNYPLSTHEDSVAMDNHAIWNHNGGQGYPVNVGSKLPNNWGLYDMLGNVWQWCNDYYAPFGDTTSLNPMGATSGTEKVARGGSCYNEALQLRASYRRGSCNPTSRDQTIGFRVVYQP